MIIEAGYDIVELLLGGVAARARTRQDDEDRDSLWVLTMDAHLRYWTTARVVQHMGASAEEHVDDIARTLNLDPRHSVYYVVSYSIQNDRGEHDEWLHDADRALNAHPSLIGHELLGHVVFDPTGFYSSVPRYSFRDYAGLEHLPRAATCAGPHSSFECTCAACTQFDEQMRANRHRHDQLLSASAGGAVNDESADDKAPNDDSVEPGVWPDAIF